MKDVSSDEDIRLAGETRELISVYREAEDLINIGAYVKGKNARIDRAIDKIDEINGFFRQGIMESVPYDEASKELAAIMCDQPVS
jgi:flagellum-specific ATP synthase